MDMKMSDMQAAAESAMQSVSEGTQQAAEAVQEGASNAKEMAKHEVEAQIARKAPESIKPLFPCLGPAMTTELCMCMVPEDQKSEMKTYIDAYKKI
mmetsp:Transcript_54183/g.121201  ORF Transcript_54183/g.121201 Transcript_54183/m.121201 type:complete len:96 (+) Transcript_54183:90-377(+)